MMCCLLHPLQVAGSAQTCYTPVCSSSSSTTAKTAVGCALAWCLLVYVAEYQTRLSNLLRLTNKRVCSCCRAYLEEMLGRVFGPSAEHLSTKLEQVSSSSSTTMHG